MAWFGERSFTMLINELDSLMVVQSGYEDTCDMF